MASCSPFNDDLCLCFLFYCSISTAEQQLIIHSGQIYPLDGAEEGALVFLEPGFYYREEGFTIHRGCTLVGASSR